MALNETRCHDLPKKFSKDSGMFWLKAIVLVKRMNGIESYVLAEQRSDGYISYVHDFGPLSPIVSLISVHPYMYLEERFINLGANASPELLLMEFPDKSGIILYGEEEDMRQLRLQYSINKQKAVENGYAEVTQDEEDDFENQRNYENEPEKEEITIPAESAMEITFADENMGTMTFEELPLPEKSTKKRGRKTKK